jgi:hypothetical protein
MGPYLKVQARDTPWRSFEMGGEALGAALRRGPDGTWYWADGVAEPRVTDLRMSDWYRFPVRVDGGQTFIEVPTQQARNDYQLRWVGFGHYQKFHSENVPAAEMERRRGVLPSLFEDPSTIEVYLVPQKEWERVELERIDARWDQEDHEDIIARAREVNDTLARAARARRAS